MIDPRLVPLAATGLVLTGLLATQWVRPLDRLFNRTALALFGRYVRGSGTGVSPAGARNRELRLHAAHLPTTYRLYAARTLLFATLVALAGSVVGVYGVAWLIDATAVGAAELRAQLPEPIHWLVPLLSDAQFTPLQLFGLLLASSATIGVTAAVFVYRMRWWWPGSVASKRERQIDASVDRTVAFVYALSRSGMEFPEVMRILARNQAVYGEAAAEIEVAVREMDVFGADMMTALQRVATRTPSEPFSEFTENLVSVLQSGRSLSRYLREQYEEFKEASEARQAQFLELLSTLAEGYVTVLVAGPLFLITILVIIGLTVGGTLTFLRVLVYVLLPLATAGVVVYLDSLSSTGEVIAKATEAAPRYGRHIDVRRVVTPATDEGTEASDRTAATDGGYPGVDPETRRRNRYRLGVHRRVRRLQRRLRDPVGAIVDDPGAVFYVTLPLAAAWVVVGAWPSLAAGGIEPTVLDDYLVQSGLFVTVAYAIAYEVHSYRLRALEQAMPDFLDRLASVHEAGMPIVESIGQVVRGDLGALDAELQRAWADVQWGAPVEDALVRFEQRVGTPTATRVVTLITRAMEASGEIGPVVRIAADEAKTTRRLARQRRQEMLTYVVVIYLSFLVFLTVIVALNVMFLPSIPTVERVGEQFVGVGGIGGLTEAEKANYELLFFHAAMVQAVCSGFVAGQMGQNSVGAGAKHAAVLLAVAYGVALGL